MSRWKYSRTRGIMIMINEVRSKMTKLRKKTCQKLVESEPKRVQEVIENKGGHISCREMCTSMSVLCITFS